MTRLIGGPFPPERVRERLAREIATQAEHGVQYWPLFLLADGGHAGCCGLRPYKTREKIYEIGFHLRPAYWGRGYAAEAARAVQAYAFDRLGAAALFAGHHPANEASRRLLGKLGFRYTHDEFYPPTGLNHPSYLLTAEEFARSRGGPAVVFDFGGVLMDWNPRHLYRKFFAGDDEAIERFLAEVGFADWNLHLDKGRPYAEVIEDQVRLYPAHQELIRAYDRRWEETLAGTLAPTVAILEELKRAGYELHGLSNWSAEKFALVSGKYEFFSWFGAIVISGEVGLAKPDPGIYQALLRRIGREAGDCLFVDDAAQNIAAARELGFQTIHYQSPAQLRLELGRLGLLPRSDPASPV